MGQVTRRAAHKLHCTRCLWMSAARRLPLCMVRTLSERKLLRCASQAIETVQFKTHLESLQHACVPGRAARLPRPTRVRVYAPAGLSGGRLGRSWKKIEEEYGKIIDADALG